MRCKREAQLEENEANKCSKKRLPPNEQNVFCLLNSDSSVGDNKNNYCSDNEQEYLSLDKK